ncbi:MAG: YncE family protein [Candidatus Korobacteraceae bacterium]
MQLLFLRFVLATTVLAITPLLVAQQTLLLASQKASSSVGFYTMDGKLLATVPVGKHPHELAISTDGRYAYTTDNGTMAIEEELQGNNTVSVVDLHSRKRTAAISLGKFYRPHGIAVVPTTGNLLVTTENPSHLVMVDPKAQKVVRTYDIKGDFPHIVSASSDGKWAYVSNAKSDSVAVVELATGAVTLIPVGTRPEGSILSKDGKRLYVVSRVASEISVIDTEKKTKIRTIKTAEGPVRVGLSPDEKYAIYGTISGNGVGFADLETGKEVTLVPVDKMRLVSMHISPDGKWALTGAQYDDTVYVVDIAARKLHTKFTTPKGAGPDPVRAISVPN